MSNIVIIGSGPASVSAALYAARAGVPVSYTHLAARKKPTKCRMRHIRQTGCGNVYLEGRPTLSLIHI